LRDSDESSVIGRFTDPAAAIITSSSTIGAHMYIGIGTLLLIIILIIIFT